MQVEDEVSQNMLYYDVDILYSVRSDPQVIVLGIQGYPESCLDKRKPCLVVQTSAVAFWLVK